MFTILPARRIRVGSYGSPRGDMRRVGRTIGDATFAFRHLHHASLAQMTALAPRLAPCSRTTGQGRYGFAGDVWAEPRAVVGMPSRHAGTANVARSEGAIRELRGVTRGDDWRLQDGQDRHGAGVRASGGPR